MKEMALDNELIEKVIDVKHDRFEIVLAENERILNRVNEHLNRINDRQELIEETVKKIEGIQYFIDWKLCKEGE